MVDIKEIAKSFVGRRAARFIGSRLPYRLAVLDRHFFAWLELLHAMERMSREEIVDYQTKTFLHILKRAYYETDFYREKYDKAGLDISKIKGLDDLGAIPLLTKAELRQHGARLVVKGKSPTRLARAATGGSTGTPLQLSVPRYAISRDWASICYQWARAGYRPGDGRVEFRGAVPGGNVLEALGPERVIRVNTSRINEVTLPRILAVIRASGYRYYHGYPSAVSEWCRLLRVAGERPDPPFAIFMASEMVYPHQLEQMRQVFPESYLFAHYGLAERVALGAWWGEGQRYHFLPAYGVVEAEESTGRLIGTSLLQDEVPLIRYLTDDATAALVGGRPDSPPYLFPVAEGIDGRLADYTYRVDGTLVAPALVTYPFMSGSTIAACKLVQRERSTIELLVEANPDARGLAAEIERAITNLKALYGEDMRFETTMVDSLERSASGKFRWIECHIDDGRDDA